MQQRRRGRGSQSSSPRHASDKPCLRCACCAGTEHSAGGAQQQEEVTGPASPLGLVLSHSVDAARGAVTVHCRVVNRTLEELRGLEVGETNFGV